MYDPKIGRWLSEDPAGLTIDANPYRYVRNSPTQFTDPSGLEPDGVMAKKTPAEQERDRINDRAREAYNDYKKKGPGWPQDTCEDQAKKTMTHIINKVNPQYWKVVPVDGVKFNPTWPPGYWFPRLTECENAIGVIPKKGNPGKPYIIDVFSGYHHQRPMGIVDWDDFWKAWPHDQYINGKPVPPPPVKPVPPYGIPY